ncbi:MAG: type II toxin-antitoxin system RelE/ParE family toxin [Dehalococcoidia bacterium]
MKTRLSRAALVEARDARRWYRQRNPTTASDFQDEYVRVRRLIQMWPSSGTDVGLGFRRLMMHGFPYSLVYRVEVNVAVIVAVAHTSREPGYWLDR